MQLIDTTQIRGKFRGCNGKRAYRLANGQYWKESTHVYAYQYAYNPAAKLWSDGSRTLLEVEGFPQMIEVKKATSSDYEEAERAGD